MAWVKWMAVRKKDPAWLAFGRTLRSCREAAGKKQHEICKALDISSGYYSNWETGAKPPPEKFMGGLDRAVDADGRVIDAWEKAKRQVAAPMRFVELPDLEAAALELREYQPLLIPGLVQTEEYARSVFEDSFPGMSSRRIEPMVQARMDRQRVLDRDPRPLVILLVAEAVLHQQLGGRGMRLLRDQWRRLIGDVEAAKVRVQIIPRDTGRHYGSGGPFRLYTFTGKASVASAEYMTGETLINDPDRYRECLTSFGLLQGEAHSEAVSLRMLKELDGST
ncbi:helix-turn-helix domain-containing protein [Nocardiopsis metallicus]|uniref:Transcriptional regulator with XRE-family HTH domain n=1 Tax=Nocardiopsis metallicus TaxID=179819 RepID=A0A840WBR3_9ACTN|nr:helix-turn-helix transcriptional regulator [Nocardiopsis metallicus]MBB5489475.1 transcriptional regulator with XRE-family HTH domain [Nocardiopsis metallicus]